MPDPQRSFDAMALLPRARAAAQAAGVTRLADITGLDRIGFPVWQAVRPLSRALSVHQGKGACAADAQLGALLEAVESHWAETFDQPGLVCRFDDLPKEERPLSLADFAAHRRRPPKRDVPHRWVEARDLHTGKRLHLPFEVVSLDFTRCVPSRFDRASNGVATGATSAEALGAALHELIERDGVVEWQSGSIVERTFSQLLLETIPFDWFGHWRDRLQRLGMGLRCYRVPALTGSPLILCDLSDTSKDAVVYQRITGHGCHPDPELALFKALAEAFQGRATYIAGAREDLLAFYRAAAPGERQTPAGLPLPKGMRGISWDEIAPGPGGPDAFGEALAATGYRRIAVVELADPEGLKVVRAFVYGLGSMTRRRGPPQ